MPRPARALLAAGIDLVLASRHIQEGIAWLWDMHADLCTFFSSRRAGQVRVVAPDHGPQGRRHLEGLVPPCSLQEHPVRLPYSIWSGVCGIRAVAGQRAPGEGSEAGADNVGDRLPLQRDGCRCPWSLARQGRQVLGGRPDPHPVCSVPSPQRRRRPYRPGQDPRCRPGSLARQVSLSRAYPARTQTQYCAYCAHERRGTLIEGVVFARSAKFLLALIKNAQANAEVNGLDKDELFVQNIVCQQAPKMRYVHVGREGEKSASC